MIEPFLELFLELVGFIIEVIKNLKSVLKR